MTFQNISERCVVVSVKTKKQEQRDRYKETDTKKQEQRDKYKETDTKEIDGMRQVQRERVTKTQVKYRENSNSSCIHKPSTRKLVPRTVLRTPNAG